jgi:hypothetical protein
LRHNVLITGLEPDEEDFAMAYRRMLAGERPVGPQAGGRVQRTKP